MTCYFWSSKGKNPLAAVALMVYDIAGSHSHIESAKIWNEF